LTGIDLSLLAGVPAFVALFICLKSGPERAFLNVYLPMLLLVPDSCRMSLSGQFNFAESAIIPIAIFYLWEEGRDWRWDFTDLLVLGFVGVVTTAECMNKDFLVAKNLAVHMTVSIILPYAVAKGMSTREGMSTQIAKRIVILATAVAIISLYEFRMTANPFRAVMSLLFPGHILEIPAFRYGFVRIAGPWNHPILAGLIFAAAYRIARWLDWTHEWPGYVPFLPISKVRFCELALVVGCVMTISRGPWIGAIVAGLVVMLLRARHRSYVTAFAVLAVFILMVPAYNSFDSYVNVNRLGIHDEAQDSAAYRREMLQDYITIAEERPVWGWGEGNFPVIDGMYSIDNHYLLLALSSGMYALALLVMILLWVPIRLGRFGVTRSPDDPATSLAITLLGLFVLYAVTLTTTWLGAQSAPLLFLIAGWSGAVVQRFPVFASAPVAVRRVKYPFERVMI
jgi:hypothetical protein